MVRRCYLATGRLPVSTPATDAFADTRGPRADSEQGEPNLRDTVYFETRKTLDPMWKSSQEAEAEAGKKYVVRNAKNESYV